MNKKTHMKDYTVSSRLRYTDSDGHVLDVRVIAIDSRPHWVGYTLLIERHAPESRGRYLRPGERFYCGRQREMNTITSVGWELDLIPREFIFA